MSSCLLPLQCDECVQAGQADAAKKAQEEAAAAQKKVALWCFCSNDPSNPPLATPFDSFSEQAAEAAAKKAQEEAAAAQKKVVLWLI